VRQEYLDDVVWRHVIELLADPVLIRTELDRRLRELRATSPVVALNVRLEAELRRVRTSMDRLLDAYQNELLSLDELRSRVPHLRRRETTIRSELDALKERAMHREKYLKPAETLESFLTKLHDAADHASLEERQRIVRLLVKEVLVGSEKIVTHHCISVSGRDPTPGYRLRWGSNVTNSCEHLPARGTGPMV
jgi:site-specific DNA recombinase